MPRIVDPNKLLLFAQVTDWLAVYRLMLEHARTPDEIQRERGLQSSRIVQLRWLLAPELGYPTEPFRVWRRPSQSALSETPVSFGHRSFFFSDTMVTLERPMSSVRVTVNAPTGGVLRAFAGMPQAAPQVAEVPLSAGVSTVRVSGAKVASLLIPPNAQVTNIVGVAFEMADDPSWQPIEVVGLPVGSNWSGVFDLDRPQGFLGAPTTPRAAALDRFRRGAPFFGWDPSLPSGAGAPVWQLADPKGILKLLETEVLDSLRTMVTTLPPNQHAKFEERRVLPPVDPLHPAIAQPDANARFLPMCNLVFGAATDPLSSLICGFGTAFDPGDNRGDWDFMVTARYKGGADGRSEPIEYAAMVFAPGRGNRPPAATHLGTESPGLRAPASVDADWLGIQRVSWDKPDDTALTRVGSYAIVREQLAPAGGATPLMGPRPFDVALQPISATASAEQAQAGRLTALDETYRVASAPSMNSLAYSIAQQDLFGLWSPWSSTNAAVSEPPVQTVSLISARIDATPASGGTPCPGTLSLDLAWNWATRSLRRIEFVGRMYPQAKLGAAPSNTLPPATLQTSLAAGPSAVLQLVFNGGPGATVVTGVPGLSATLEYLSADGKQLLATPSTEPAPRRYRLTLSGLALDFVASGCIGLALWARGIEQRAPNRVGAFAAQPLIVSTADPRPPVLSVEHEDVLLTSLADAAGLHHARLSWPAASGATGYFIYTTTEMKLRADRGLNEPPKSATLSQRLSALRDAFANDPSRRSFTRVNATAVTSTSLQVTLPRGSKEIHLYIVLGVSAGQVESEWPAPGSPNLRKRPIAYAAPQIAVPSPPDLEVTRTLDSSVTPAVYRAGLRVRTKPGAPVTRVDIHRVRVPEAAIELDTMGPPIARVVGSAAPFVVTPTLSDVAGEAQTLGIIAGLDAVGGAWRRVFYRAAAWSGDDPSRGIYGGRSKPSAVREVLVPPPGPPELAPLVWQWQGGGTSVVQIDSSTTAPLATTPLGDHRLRADVLVQHADGRAETLLQYPSVPGGDERLLALATAPPVAGSAGLWRAGSDENTSIHIRVPTTPSEDQLKVRILLSDPLGRATERTLTVPLSPISPMPDILSLSARRRPPAGYLVQFLTHGLETYRLSLRYAPALGSPRTFRVVLGEIPPAGDEELLELPDLLPIRQRQEAGGVTRIGFGLRGTSGRLTLALSAPDGRRANEELVLP